MTLRTEIHKWQEGTPAGTESEGQAKRLQAVASVGSIVSAFIASACCVGPLVFALLGLGGAGLLVKFEPYRPLFIAVTAALLGTGFYLTYWKPKTAGVEGADGPACDCGAPRTNRAGRVMLWVATFLVALFLAFPYIAAFIWG